VVAVHLEVDLAQMAGEVVLFHCWLGTKKKPTRPKTRGVFDCVGLPFNEPPDPGGLPFIQSSEIGMFSGLGAEHRSTTAPNRRSL
jgi:hypothetical protein